MAKLATPELIKERNYPLVAGEAVVGVHGSLDVLEEVVRDVRVRAAGRVGAADFLVVGIGTGGFFSWTNARKRPVEKNEIASKNQHN